MNNKEFSEYFMSVFCKNLNKNDFKKFRVGYKDGYLLWNVFGHKLYPCLEGDQARNEFDCVSKQGASEIHLYWTNNSSNLIPLTLEHNSSLKIDLEGLTEFYVIGKNFEWVYVVTHEMDDAGPYFAQMQIE